MEQTVNKEQMEKMEQMIKMEQTEKLEQTEKMWIENNNTPIQNKTEKTTTDRQYKTYKFFTEKSQKRALNSIDSILAVFLFAPLVVSFWRGTWNLMNIYQEKHPNAIPLWESFFFSVAILFCFTLLRDSLSQFVKKRNKTFFQRATNQILSKLYTYCFALVCIMHWRSTWMILDQYFMDPNDIVVITSLTILLLVVLRSLRNTSAPPFIVIMDYEEVTFTFPTRFGKKVSH